MAPIRTKRVRSIFLQIPNTSRDGRVANCYRCAEVAVSDAGTLLCGSLIWERDIKVYSSESEGKKNLWKVSRKWLGDEEWRRKKLLSGFWWKWAQTPRTAFTSSHMQLKTNIWFNYRFCSRNGDGKERERQPVRQVKRYMSAAGARQRPRRPECIVAVLSTAYD